ncbi:MAG: hypothetical protein CMI53_04755 [Parcubacteria group bacterium]|nr:hypothetical protein [Parcubacteria group bacterium]|tara:strand:+ start:6601 stop:7515 length:915 start_codon:yes stop_codon:yes gene_type:complete
MAIKTIKTKELNWYYLTDFSNKELDFLKNNFKFHPLDLKDCAGEIQRTKIDSYKNYLFLVFQLPTIEKKSKRVGIEQIYIFVGKDYLVVIGPKKVKSLANIFYKAVNNNSFKEDVTMQGSGYLLYRILDSLLRSSWTVHQYLDQEIGSVELEIDAGRGKKLVFDIAFLRRIILQLKTIIDPQRLVTNTLSRMNTNFLGKDMAVYFDDLDDFIEKNLFILESYKDRILSLHEINESLISYRTNTIMKILTIFSVALLPLTLLTGIYGMNVDLPYTNTPGSIWIIFGILSLFIIGIFLVLKKKNWI